MNTPKGLILLRHNGFAKITVDECLKALPKEWLAVDRKDIEINYLENINLATLYELNFSQYALEHRRLFNTEIADLLSKYPDYKIIYFGLAPIPLAIDLGYLFHNYRDIEIYQKHHVTKEWYIEIPNENEANEIKTEGLPEEYQKGIAEILLRLNVSHSIKSDDTNEILSNAAEIDINLETLNEDAISTKLLMSKLGEEVKNSFDHISNLPSHLEVIHLFASIPCGLAFLIGTKISPNIHPYIQTYQYSRTKSPKYIKAILIKSDIIADAKISEEDKKLADEKRNLCNVELTTNIRAYCKINRDMSTNRIWYQGLMTDLQPNIMSSNFWSNLPAIYETSLASDSFDFETEVINDGFYWRQDKWYVDDNFFISISRRLKNDTEIKKAIRLFLFHEAVHYKKHKLTDLTSVDIGSFSKVLETADYQADVYAILNEYGYYSKTEKEISKKEVKKIFLDTIKIAIETMWSFDDNGIKLDEIQIRRLNRYMIWYWQLARIEKDGNSLDEIISILEQKPIIELNGLKSKEENNRFFFKLEKRNNQPLELSIFYNNEIYRNGSANNLPIENIISGVKDRNGDLILKVMRSLIDMY